MVSGSKDKVLQCKIDPCAKCSNRVYGEFGDMHKM